MPSAERSLSVARLDTLAGKKQRLEVARLAQDICQKPEFATHNNKYVLETHAVAYGVGSLTVHVATLEDFEHNDPNPKLIVEVTDPVDISERVYHYREFIMTGYRKIRPYYEIDVQGGYKIQDIDTLSFVSQLDDFDMDKIEADKSKRVKRRDERRERKAVEMLEGMTRLTDFTVANYQDVLGVLSGFDEKNIIATGQRAAERFYV